MATGTPRNKTVLKPGFGLMDWVKLTTSSTDLAGVRRLGGLRGYRMEEVAQHKSPHDAWAVFMGKVYNITPYLHYHPGGADILLKSAGRDCTALFNRYHAWVNLDGLAGKLVVGYLIEEEGQEGASTNGAGQPTPSAAGGDGARPSAPSSSSAASASDSSSGGSGSRQFAMDPPPPPPPRRVVPVGEALMGKEGEEDEEEEGDDAMDQQR